MMTEAKQRAHDVLDVLYTERRVTDEEYGALDAGLQEKAPLGDGGITCTVFLVDGPFGDEEMPYLRFDSVDREELGTLLRLAMRQDFDMVVRREGT